jgi:hydroxypyruvate reductase
MPDANARDMLRGLFERALSQSSIERAFARHLEYEAGVLRIGEDLYSLSDYDRVLAISIGKAAPLMAQALASQAGSLVGGIVAGSTDPSPMAPGFEYFCGGHPLPDAGSVKGAEAILRALRGVTADSLVIFLISGGGSAAVEKPLGGLSLDDLAATYDVLVRCGAPIVPVNAIRKHLSAIKGGRLAQASAPARQVSVLVADVPPHALDALASGPSMPDSTTVEDCYRIAAQYDLLGQFPPRVRSLFTQRVLEETPKADDWEFASARWHVVLSNETVTKAAEEDARRQGFEVEIDNRCDDWDYAAAGDYLLTRLRQLRLHAPRVCLLSGGEVTVRVTGKGRGGRNQQFTLYCATRIAGENIAVLSAGTDGIDGNSPAAGAVADGTSMARAFSLGYDVAHALESCDAFPLFEALGDTITTGPTGNNLRDLRVLVAW